MSVKEENMNNASNKFESEEINKVKNRIACETIEEKVRENLDSLNEQILNINKITSTTH